MFSFTVKLPIHTSPKSSFYFWGGPFILTFRLFLYWPVQCSVLSVQTFQPLIVIHKRGNFVYHHRGCALIYRPLSYPFRSLLRIIDHENESKIHITVRDTVIEQWGGGDSTNMIISLPQDFNGKGWTSYFSEKLINSINTCTLIFITRLLVLCYSR